MEDEARKVRAAYFRQWRRRNPDKVQAINARYWARRAEKLRQQADQQIAENKERSEQSE